MKTETEIKQHLKDLKRQYKDTKKRFEKDDCIDDYEYLKELEAHIDTTEWVLEVQ